MSSVTFSTTVGGDGSTVTDDDDATTGLRNGGWRTRFVPALAQEVAVAGNAVASATAALSSKNAAAASASTATTQASNASTSATNAANSATAAAASYDSFDDRYLGVKTSDPSVDNDGNALLVGALYWNSATSVFKVWSGSVWITNLTSNQFGTNVATFLQTPSSANLAAALTDETGTGSAVFATSPTFPAQINLTASSGYNIYASGTAANFFGGNTVVSVTNTSAALTVTQTGTGNAFVVEDSASTDSTPFVIGNDGHVVIGAVSGYTSNMLTVSGNSSTGYFWQLVNAADNLGFTQRFLKNRNTDVYSNTVVQSGDSLGRILFAGADGTGFIDGASIQVAVDGTPGTNDMPGRLVFATTADGASSPTERMRIDSAGNVGIGGGAGAGQKLVVGGNLTGAATAYGQWNYLNILSDVTSEAIGFATALGTNASAFTTNISHFKAIQNAIGAGSTVSSQYGFNVTSSCTGATNNYGFYGNIASGTNRYNLYMAGTADNAFSGDVNIFGAGKLGYTTGSGGAVTQATSRTTSVTINKTNGAITLVSAAGLATYQSFTVTNSTVVATDTIIVNQKSGTDKYIILVTNVAAGSFQITFATTGGLTTEQPIFNFALIKAVNA